MLSELREIVKEQFGDKFIDTILANYCPADGTYILVKENDCGELNIISKINIQYDKKLKDVDRTLNNFDKFAKADYFSKLIDMNKPIDGKKVIHSNNYNAFFVKKQSLKEKKLTNEIIDNYYTTLKNPIMKYEKKSKAKLLYEQVEDNIGATDVERVEKIQKWIKENIYTIEENIDKKDYLKIFFTDNDELLEKEGRRYLIPNIYNNNDFNIETDNGILGLPNNNMGMNSKKPFLENKSRKVKVPYLLNQEQVVLQNQIFDYLYSQASQGKRNIYIKSNEILPLEDGKLPEQPIEGYYIRAEKGKELEIHDFDVISKYSPKLRKKFEFKNILGQEIETLYKLNSGKGVDIEYTPKSKLKEMQELINTVLFSNYLKTNYFSEDLSINDSVLKRSILQSRKKLFAWFYKGNSIGIGNLLYEVSKNLMKNSIEKGYYIRAMNQFNLMYSLKEYFIEGGENMADIIFAMKNNLRSKITEKDTGKIESDNEYFFAVGQLVNFFLSKSKGKNKPLSLANPIINAKSDKVIKDKLKSLYKKYNYDIQVTDIRVKNLYAMILGYECEGKINEDLIIAGYLNNSLIYEKKGE